MRSFCGETAVGFCTLLSGVKVAAGFGGFGFDESADCIEGFRIRSDLIRCSLIRRSRIRGSKKIDLGAGAGLRSELANFDDQAIWIRLQAHGEIRCAIGFEHYASHSGNGLSDANAFEQRIVYGNHSIGKRGCKRGVVQVKINSLRFRKPMSFILDLILHIDHNRAGFGRRPMTDACDLGQHAGFLGCYRGRIAFVVGLRCGFYDCGCSCRGLRDGCRRHD